MWELTNVLLVQVGLEILYIGYELILAYKQSLFFPFFLPLILLTVLQAYSILSSPPKLWILKVQPQIHHLPGL